MYQRNVSLRFGGPVTPVVKKLMIINGAVFIFQQIAGLFSPGYVESIFGLSHAGLAYRFMIWQPFTYMFLHGGWLHIIFNLVALWMFAGEVENLLGEKRFLRFYLLSGFGAGIFIALMNFYIFSNQGMGPVTIGASGAIYAILLAYGITWPNREVLLYFILPVKIKYLLLFFGLIEFFGTLSTASGTGGGISHIGHLGGLICGFFIFKSMRSRGIAGSTGKSSILSELEKKRRLKKKQDEINTRIQAKKIIDASLEKIAKSGMSSLTPDEKKKLEWARRHFYPSDNETMH
jgi:membrane associated rhomboid family serine protease